MREFFAPVLDAFSGLLGGLQGLFEPIFPGAGWGWAIIALTLIVRVALLPLAIKQTRSMRAMSALQPQVKALQDKYKVDRDLMRRDPEKYKARKQRLNEELMGLYQREGVNPAASCLPLLAQAPIFLALFWTLQGEAALERAEFYFFTSVGEGGLRMTITQAGWPGWLLILLMSGTLFWSQKQMMARNAASGADNPMAQQQKVLLYVMPVFLAAISINFPVGVVLYWATTNVWQVAQQAIILREVRHEGDVAERRREGSDGTERRRSPGASSGRRSTDAPGDVDAPARNDDGSADASEDDDGSDTDPGPGDEGDGPRRPRLPRRGGGR